jgi:alanyl-tRNA synthetase
VQINKGDKYLHYGKMLSGELSIEDAVNAEVDAPRRLAIMRSHTATHLMHHALQAVLGEHINQAGSLVEPDKLRFDFTHFSALTTDEISTVERYVNNSILDGLPVSMSEMPIEDAKKLGALALFDEKYSDIVRVITMGDSVELCGGTHLNNTARVGAFAILSEFSVASGVRRIEAVTGNKTLELLNTSRSSLSRLSGLLKANAPDEIAGKLEQNLATIRELRAKVDSALIKESDNEARRILTGARVIGNLKVITAFIEDVDVDIDKLRQIEDTLRDWESGVVAVLAAIKNSKITIMAACGKLAVESGINAGELIREVTKICGGSGGGKPEFAMGGGKDIEKLKAALAAVDSFVKDKLNLS